MPGDIGDVQSIHDQFPAVLESTKTQRKAMNRSVARDSNNITSEGKHLKDILADVQSG